jgi:major membrane immunogen (membrane-anchored lipoprotein)
MNSKDVLNKIAKMLNLTAVELTEAKSADGKILSSPTFDLNEDVEVVSEDGTKTPAPDGEYTISLKDTEGNENIIRIEVKDGKITERANEEEEKNEGEGEEEMGEKVKEEVVDKKAAVEEHLADATTKEAHALPNTTDEDPRNRIGKDTDDKKDPIISLSYRIDELEAMVKDLHTKMQSAYPEAGAPEVSSLIPSGTNMSAVDEDEEELPKLDGAPIDPIAVQQNQKSFGKKSADYQSTVLSKMYR